MNEPDTERQLKKRLSMLICLPMRFVSETSELHVARQSETSAHLPPKYSQHEKAKPPSSSI